MGKAIGRNAMEDISYIIYEARTKFGESPVVDFLEETFLDFFEVVNPLAKRELSQLTMRTGLITRTKKIDGVWTKGATEQIPYHNRED